MTHYNQCGCNDCRPDYCPDHCPDHHPNINQTILSCGSGSGLIIPVHSESNSQLYNPYVIASVALDTSELHKANVKIDFSSIIMFRTSSQEALRLILQLSKTYISGGRIPLATWNFTRDFNNVAAFETVDSFCFTWCECDACPGCAYYTVELINVENPGADAAVISNAFINALAVGPWVWDCDAG